MSKEVRKILSQKNKIIDELNKILDWSEKGLHFCKKYGCHFTEQEELLMFIAVLQPISLDNIEKSYGSEGLEYLKDLIQEEKIEIEGSNCKIKSSYQFQLFGKVV